MATTPLHLLTASEALLRLREGTLTAEAYAQALLDRIHARDDAVKAWAFIDPDLVLEQARVLDKIPVQERGSLHGLPVGIKDIIYTKDMPTEHNSTIYKGSFPQVDASSVMILRHAGALIFATIVGPKTVNPNSSSVIHTPGGSSSGSGAAVGDAQVPLALATQTAGSVIRPASFNGIYGLKPTWGTVSSGGQRVHSMLLDTLGWFGRSVADLAVLADVFGLKDDEPSTFNSIRGAKFAICRTDNWPFVGEGTKKALDKAVALLGDHGATVDQLSLPSSFGRLPEWHRTLTQTDGRIAFLPERLVGKEKLHESLAAFVDKPQFSKKQQLAAQDGIAALRPEWDAIASEYDAVLTASVVDEAPEGLGHTGDPVFCAIWTALHAPVINIPGFRGSTGMPIGVSLVASRYRDLHLLKVAEDVGKIFESEGGWQRTLS
ncbi:hypothetical protein ACJ41O_006098 [Fusarium nematophilum]